VSFKLGKTRKKVSGELHFAKSVTITTMSLISNRTAPEIKDAASVLINGNLVAFPTETVYGLGANATDEDAISRIYQVKGRPTDHPLIVHISSIENVDKWARDIPGYAIKLASAFWPGPMTLILPRTDLAKDFITGGQNNVGIRVPAHNVALELLKKFEALGGLGVAAPSANRFGAVSPTTASAVETELGKYFSKLDLILDGGPSLVGIESTIIDCTQSIPSILRPGGITRAAIEQTVGNLVGINNKNLSVNKVKVPGLLESHYAPKANVFLNGKPSKGDGLIALAGISTPNGVLRLASPTNNVQFAQQLYTALRSADAQNLKNVYVIPPSGNDIAVAINDRLSKASKR
jgi:L-threonylcarbamoyladenylate synthase